MNRERAVPGPGADGVQTVISRDRAVAGPVTDAVQPVMNRDRAVPTHGGDGVQTVVSPDSGDMLDGGAAGEKRLFSNAVAGGRDAQAVENHTEPPPTNAVLVPPQQVHAREQSWVFLLIAYSYSFNFLGGGGYICGSRNMVL